MYSRQPEAPLASVTVGDARSLSWNDKTVDAVLLLGPLYHLTARADRIRALTEAHRVLKAAGLLFAVGISRFASTMDGLRSGFLKDAQFADIVDRDLKDGQHRNPTTRPEYFTDAFFHHPDELRQEVTEAGFVLTGVYGLEGPAMDLCISAGSGSRPYFPLNTSNVTPESVTSRYSAQFGFTSSILKAMRSACTKYCPSTANVCVSVPSRSNTTRFISVHWIIGASLA